MRGVSSTRRRFAFWVGLGLFQLSERLSADGLDQLAAKTMDLAGKGGAETQGGAETLVAKPVEHWSLEQNASWRWYQRERLVDGKWRVTGITTPVNKATGLPGSTDPRYLDERLVPREVKQPAAVALPEQSVDAPGARLVARSESGRQPDPIRRARHGRPPSRWLRSLRSGELRIWLRKISVTEARVEGMTYFTHLTRDHSFQAEHIQGLSITEQAKLHAAAHAGY